MTGTDNTNTGTLAPAPKNLTPQNCNGIGIILSKVPNKKYECLPFLSSSIDKRLASVGVLIRLADACAELPLLLLFPPPSGRGAMLADDSSMSALLMGRFLSGSEVQVNNQKSQNIGLIKFWAFWRVLSINYKNSNITLLKI